MFIAAIKILKLLGGVMAENIQRIERISLESLLDYIVGALHVPSSSLFIWPPGPLFIPCYSSIWHKKYSLNIPKAFKIVYFWRLFAVVYFPKNIFLLSLRCQRSVAWHVNGNQRSCHENNINKLRHKYTYI